MESINRQWLLKRRPNAALSEADFEYRKVALPEPRLEDGEILVRNLYLGFDPAQREWIKDQESYLPPVAIGEVMRAFAVAQVVRSRNPAYPEGSLVQGLFGWQDHAIGDPRAVVPPMLLPAELPPTLALSVLGATTLTAYFGLLDVGGLKTGQTVVVSAAAGATGSAAVQIAHIKGARVIGIAGGPKKCAWIRDELGATAIDYHNENVAARLAEYCPQGIDLYFDNVGGAILEGAIEHIAAHGRIVLCGQIAGYDTTTPLAGPRNLIRLIYQRARIEGFLMLDYMDRIPEAMLEIGTWVFEGKMRWREDIQQGFENIPRTLMRLFRGENEGKQLLQLADPQ